MSSGHWDLQSRAENNNNNDKELGNKEEEDVSASGQFIPLGVETATLLS